MLYCHQKSDWARVPIKARGYAFYFILSVWVSLVLFLVDRYLYHKGCHPLWPYLAPVGVLSDEKTKTKLAIEAQLIEV